MKYLVTGGAGFIGQHLVRLLSEQGHEVTVLDDFSTGSEQNLQGLEVTVIRGSVQDEGLVERAVSTSDIVIHLAAAVGVRLVIEKPLASLLTNIRGTEVVLASCARHKTRVLIASSSEVYGKNDQIPLGERSDRVLGNTHVARWSYACAKAADEYLAIFYHKEKDVPSTVFRLFNTVGPGQSAFYGMVIPRFVKQALADEPISVYGDGTQVRCFAHVKDVVQAIAALSLKETAVGMTVNIGSAQQTTIRGLAEMVKEVTKSSSKIAYVPYEEVYGADFEDIEKRVPDVSAIETLIGWGATTTLQKIIEDVVVHERAKR